MSSQEQQHPLNNTLYRSNLPDTPVPADTNLDLKIQTIKGTEPYTVGWVRTYKVDGKEVTVNWLYDGQGNQSPMNASSSRTIPGTNQILHFNGNSVGSTKNSAPDSSVQEYLVGAQSSETKGPYTEGFNLKADDSSLSIDALKKENADLKMEYQAYVLEQLIRESKTNPAITEQLKKAFADQLNLVNDANYKITLDQNLSSLLKGPSNPNLNVLVKNFLSGLEGQLNNSNSANSQTEDLLHILKIDSVALWNGNSTIIAGALEHCAVKKEAIKKQHPKGPVTGRVSLNGPSTTQNKPLSSQVTKSGTPVNGNRAIQMPKTDSSSYTGPQSEWKK